MRSARCVVVTPMSSLFQAPLLVGRERELAVLRQSLDAAFAGRGSLVLIGGEAGIGKTALAEAISQEAAERGALVLLGRCYDLIQTPPYGPWIELFGRYPPGDDLPPLPAAFGQRGTIGKMASQDALYRQAQDFLTAVASCRPVTLVLDDLHWADLVSLDLLRSLARHLIASPILIVATYRTEELADDHSLTVLFPALVREAKVERLNLGPLDDDAVRALVAARFPLSDEHAERLIDYLRAHAEGNPFFISELLRTLQEEGVLRSMGSAWALGETAVVRIPPLVRQVIEGRLERFDEVMRRLLAIAAVIGHEVPLALWMAVADVDEETVLAAVERAVAAHLLVESPDGTHARFVHALVRETLYNGLAPSRRRVMHRQVGEALEPIREVV